jgi:lipopolysaccharide cholinephosphotransferase
VKFISLRNKLDNTDYEILFDESQNYPMPFAKFCNKNVTIWERKSIPCIYGSYVDIFPMYEVNDTTETERQFNIHRDSFWRLAESRKSYELSDWLILLKQKKILPFLKLPFKIFYDRMMASSNYKKYKTVDHNIEIVGGSNYLSMSGISSYKRQSYSKSWFGEGVLMPFEDFFIRLPKKYDLYLTHMFGNYRILPPVEERVSHHYLYYYDLNQRLTVDDCRKIIKKMDSRLFNEKDNSWYRY